MRATQTKNRFHLVTILALLAILVAGTAGGIYWAMNWSASARARKLVNPVPPTRRDIAAGMQIYRNLCQKCHGANGDGKGEKAAELFVAPRDFSDAHEMRAWTDGELFWSITKGHRPMPAFADKLTEAERWQAVDYVRTFAGNPAPSAAAPANGLTSP
jgi:mono/diheme cytochrome c family protein